MRLNIVSNGNEVYAALLKKTVARRVPVESGESLEIALQVRADLGPAESYCIEQTVRGWCVTGADGAGLGFGIGKLLHTAKWTAEGFAPRPTVGVIAPECSLRAMYFAIHLHNWYANAPAAELEQYVEELFLWGYNAIMVIVPVIDLYAFDEEKARISVGKSRAIFEVAKRLGMKTGIFICPNQGLRGAPQELSAEPNFDPMHSRGNAGRNICVAKPGALEYLSTVWKGQLSQFDGIGLD